MRRQGAQLPPNPECALVEAQLIQKAMVLQAEKDSLTVSDEEIEASIENQIRGFIIQYNLLLQALHVEIGWWHGFWIVSILFLCLAIWPTIAILELGLRWEYSLLLFSLYSSNTVGIYAVATAIWLINLVLPALAGALFLLGLRIFKKQEATTGRNENLLKTK